MARKQRKKAHHAKPSQQLPLSAAPVAPVVAAAKVAVPRKAVLDYKLTHAQQDMKKIGIIAAGILSSYALLYVLNSTLHWF